MKLSRGEATDKVVVAGAINTDLVGVVEHAPAAGETVTGRSFGIFGGGKGANQAVAARRSGAEVALVGALGTDAFGDQRKAELLADGVDMASVVRRGDSSSGVALILVEESGENRIAYIPGATSTISGQQVVDAIRRVSPDVYLQPNEVPQATARAGLAVAGEIGALRILNAAPDPITVRPLLDQVDLLIVNQGEALALMNAGEGHDGDLLLLATQLAGACSVDVVVTGGAAGAFAACQGETTHVPTPKVEVVDTTGAGDAFCGALAAWLAQGAELRKALTWAVTAASLSATIAGAQPSIPHATAIQGMLDSG